MRQSPTESATLNQIGTKRKGNDGNIWVVVENSNGVKRWKKIESLKSKVSRKRTHTHHLIFGEPSTIPGSGSFDVNDKMYRKLTQEPVVLKKPIRSRSKRLAAAGYLFGKKFKDSEYKEIGSHGNDVAQTGIIDADLMHSPRDHKLENDISEAFKAKKWNWNDRKSLQNLRKTHPEILWIGYTFGGDVGSTYYAHYDKNHEIDSLIVDVFYFQQADDI